MAGNLFGSHMDTSEPNVAPPEILYHYTTLAGACGIGKSRSLWATSIRHLNDSTEFAHAYGVVHDVLEQRVGSLNSGTEIRRALELFMRSLEAARSGVSPLFFLGVPPFAYVVSLSEVGDQLSQWRTYSQGGGYALGFRTCRLKAISEGQRFRLVRCVYSKQAQLNQAQAIVERIIESLSGDLETIDPADSIRLEEASRNVGRTALLEISRMAPTWKHDGFEEEKEWRLVYQPKEDGDLEVQFRAGRTAIIPYVELKFDMPADSLAATDEIEVLHDLVVGPCPEPGLALSSMRYLLKVQGLACPVCSLSRIPYRHW
jgi:hypothetical protein